GEGGEHGGDLAVFQKVQQAHQHGVNFIEIRTDKIGDGIDDDNLRAELVDQIMNAQQMHFQAMLAGTPGVKSQQTFFMYCPRLIPTEPILRVTCAEDSSNAMYKARLPLRQVSLAKCAATVDLPEPEVPDTNIDEPLKKPPPSSIVSRSSMPG